MWDQALLITAVSLIFILAGFVKGVLGMGLPTVAIGILGLVIAPVEAAAMLVLPSLVTNIWQLVAGPSFRQLTKRFMTLLIGICLGTPIGVSFIVMGSVNLVSMGLGAVLAAYGLMGLLRPHYSVPAMWEKRLSPVIGFATGILMGATGISALPAAPYFGALNLKREDMIQALGLSFTVSSLMLALGLLASGTFRMEVAGSSMLALIPAFAGMFLGQWVRDKLPQEAFRRCFFGGLVVLGAYMAFRAWQLLFG